MQAETTDVVLLADWLADDRGTLYPILRGLHRHLRRHGPVCALSTIANWWSMLRAAARVCSVWHLMPFKSFCRCITSVYQGQFWTNTEQMRFIINARSIGPSGRLTNSRGQVRADFPRRANRQSGNGRLNNLEIALRLNFGGEHGQEVVVADLGQAWCFERDRTRALYALRDWQARTSDSVQQGRVSDSVRQQQPSCGSVEPVAAPLHGTSAIDAVIPVADDNSTLPFP